MIHADGGAIDYGPGFSDSDARGDAGNSLEKEDVRQNMRRPGIEPGL
ncbi:hypothetical protein AB7C87_15455 [Natrarchaeobius sp. A-rgal3]